MADVDISAIKKQTEEAAKIVDSLQKRQQGAKTPGEREILREYIHIFKTLRQVIRDCEARMLNAGSSRDAYALCTLYSQMREVIADIRTISDLSEQVLMLGDTVLTPYKSNLIQNVTDAFYQMRKMVQEVVPKKEQKFAEDAVARIFSDLGMAIDVSHTEANNTLQQTLAGGEEKPKPKRRKKR